MNNTETFRKYENDLDFRHYRFLIEKQTYKNAKIIKVIVISILLINLIQMILMLLLLGK